MNTISPSSLKRSRILYIFEAALEYLISLLVSGSFLATLTKELGLSDSLTGILSSVISLGCIFQLLSLSVRRARVKGLVFTFSVINQLLFMLLYVVPLVSLGKEIKIALFVILIFSAYLIYNFAHPKKMAWLMSLVEGKKRGSFTANKEIFSLISGMIFSFAMGSLIDHFSEAGETRIAFSLSALVIFVLMVLHSLTMVFSVEKEIPQRKALNPIRAFGELAKDKRIRRVTAVFILYYVSTYVSTPFYGTYKISELNLELSFISLIVMCGSVSRIFVSKFWGRYADKRSFAEMVEKCFIILAASQLCVVFATPKVGKVMFILYYFLHGIALGGINSALTNLVFDYAAPEKRADALAVTQASAGLAGFLTTLCVSPLISHIQKSGNRLLGVPVYAQQFVSLLAFFITVATIVFVRKAFIRKNKS